MKHLSRIGADANAIPPPRDVAADDFEAIEAAVMETARGRWFLGEFARRRRGEETAALLAAIERLETRAIEIAAAEARARAEAERASRTLNEIAEMLRDGRRRLDARALTAAGGDIEARLAALAGLDSLDVEAKSRLFG